MLRKPRRLPQRFNRPVTRQTRNLVERRLQRRRNYAFQRWQRGFQRIQRKIGSMKKTIALFSGLLVAGLVLLGMGLALFSPILNVLEIQVMRSDPRIDPERVQRSLASVFGKHLFFLTEQEVTNILESSLPDLSSAEIQKSYPSTLRVRIALDPVVARLEIDNPDTDAAGTGAVMTGSGTLPGSQDYLTSEGVYAVYFPSQVQAGTGLILLRITDWGVRPEPWKPLIEPQFLTTMRKAEDALRLDFDVLIRSRAAYIRAREFHIQTATHTLWFDLRSTVDEQLERYRLFLGSAGATAAKQYVDLRLKDKIVYK